MRLRGLAFALRDRDALPPELLDRDERLLQVRVLGDEVRAEVEREPLWVEDVRGGLGEVWRVRGGSGRTMPPIEESYAQ